MYKTLQQQVTLRGQSQSTLNNYIRRIALISLHFEQLPEHINDDELKEYLTSLALDKNSPSRSSFKHMVYGLRYYFRHTGQNKRAINLPSLKKKASLPVILNRSELKELFRAPKLLKHRIVLALIYSAGLRGQEVINLKLSDIDFERKTIHIRQSKYKKDRIVPLSDYIAHWLQLIIFYFALLNNKSAGQPNSLCLQYLQVNVPRIKPLPIVVNNNSNNNADNKIKSNFKINRIIPITNGINDTKISGIISLQVMSLIQNFEISPFLKNHELSLPFPNPQVLPQ